MASISLEDLLEGLSQEELDELSGDIDPGSVSETLIKQLNQHILFYD